MPNGPFTPEQIAQILEEFFKTVGTRQYIGSRYVPIFGRKGEESIEWDNTGTYEPLSIVLYQGNSYTSRQFVPVGVDITNLEFWANTGNYNAQVEQYRRETAAAAAAAAAAQADIDALLPKSAFDAENTVKAYVDKSAFDAENTVKAYVDATNAETRELINTLLQTSVASDYGTERFTGSEGNRTTVYWAKIPKTYKPVLRLANDAVDSVQYEIDAAWHNKSSIQINAGIFDTSTGATHGPIIEQGQVVKNTAYAGSDRNFIGMDADGKLFTYSGQNVTGETLKDVLNPQWACIAFYSIIENGVFVATERYKRDFEPRSIIAQDAAGNYCVMCCEGRKFGNAGMSLWDVRDFLNHIGFMAQFAFNLDGGASASICVNGIRVNKLVDDNHRAVANFISFEEERTYAELFDSNHAIANFLITNNKQVATLYGSSYTQYVETDANVARTITQVDRSSTDFAYTPTMREAVETSTGLYRLLLKSANDADVVTAFTLNPRYKVGSLWAKNIIVEDSVNYLSWNSSRNPSTTYDLENTTKSLKYLAILLTHDAIYKTIEMYPYNFDETWPTREACFLNNDGTVGTIKLTFDDTNNTVSYTATYSDGTPRTPHLCRLIGVRSR